jgi:hypothetical protein
MLRIEADNSPKAESLGDSAALVRELTRVDDAAHG